MITRQYESLDETVFPKETLKRELADELMDIIDSEFFAGALYELCMATFTATVNTFLAE